MAALDLHQFTYNTLREGYVEICQSVLDYGEDASPRGYRTREILNPTVVIQQPEDTLPVGVGRRPSLDVAAVEATQLCGGFSDPELTVGASSNFEQFREPVTREFHGAYGARIQGQALAVVHKLRLDPDSRQAVITLWNPVQDNMPRKLDYPCTVSLQFLVRRNRLLLTTNMRSNDVWLGLAYDLFQFGQLQWTVANQLGLVAGPLTHRPVSLHAYERNWAQIENLHRPSPKPPDQVLFGFSTLQAAHRIGHGLEGDLPPLTPSEQWYVNRLDGLRVKMQDAREAT